MSTEPMVRYSEAMELRRTPDEYAVWHELARATEKFGPFASGHEALAVIEEEFLEFRAAVFWGSGDPRIEAIQLAAMALRYLRDCRESATDVPGPTVAHDGYGANLPDD